MQRLGQHFLRDRSVLAKILAASMLTRSDVVLEIGAGTGILTDALAERAKKVIAVEKDPRLCALLEKKFGGRQNVRIVCDDILGFDPTHYSLLTTHYKVIANIPYYITGRLLRMIGEEWQRPKLIVLMLQKEVAERIATKPPKMSLLAVSVQLWARPEIVARVPREAFSPKPEVSSAILRLTPLPRQRSSSVASGQLSVVLAVVRLGFRQPRKLLASNLAKGFPRERVREAFAKLRLSPTARPAELSAEQWQDLSAKLLGAR